MERSTSSSRPAVHRPVRPASFAAGDALHVADGRSFVSDGEHWEGRGSLSAGLGSSTERVTSYLAGGPHWQERLLHFEPAPVGETDTALPGTPLTDLPAIDPDSVWLPYVADSEAPRLTLLRESLRDLGGDTYGMPYTRLGHEVTAALSSLTDTARDGSGLELSRRPESGALYARRRPASVTATSAAAMTYVYVYIPAIVEGD